MQRPNEQKNKDCRVGQLTKSIQWWLLSPILNPHYHALDEGGGWQKGKWDKSANSKTLSQMHTGKGQPVQCASKIESKDEQN